MKKPRENKGAEWDDNRGERRTWRREMIKIMKEEMKKLWQQK